MREAQPWEKRSHGLVRRRSTLTSAGGTGICPFPTRPFDAAVTHDMEQTRSTEPLSALDAAFLFFERPEQPLVVGCIAELERPIEPALLLEKLEALVEAHPRFRQRLVRLPLDMERPGWEDDDAFALIRHFRSVTWSGQGLGDVTEAVLSSALSSDRSPWEVVSVTGGPDDRAAVILRAHHCMLDGMSGMRVVELLTDADGESPRRRKTKKPNGRRAWAAGEDVWGSPFGENGGGAPVWDHMREVAELTSTVVSLLHDDPAPQTAVNAPLTSRRRAAWATFDRRDYGPICSETGATLNEVALSVVAGALRRHLWRHDRASAKRTLRSLVPVSLRAGTEPGELGNQISAMFPRLPVEIADPLERLERVMREMETLRLRGQARATAYGLRMMGSLPPMVEAALPMLIPQSPIVNTVCTNVRGPRRACTLAGSRILGLHGIVPLFHGMGVEFAIVTHEDRLSVCAHFDPTIVKHGDELSRDLEESFAQLRRAEKRTRKHRREIKRLGALLRPVSRAARATDDEPKKPSRRSRK